MLLGTVPRPLRIWALLTLVMAASQTVIGSFSVGSVDLSTQSLVLILAVPLYQTLGFLGLPVRGRRDRGTGRWWALLLLGDLLVLGMAATLPGSFALTPLALYLAAKSILELLVSRSQVPAGWLAQCLTLALCTVFVLAGPDNPTGWGLLMACGLLFPAQVLPGLQRRPGLGLLAAVLLWFPLSWLGLFPLLTPGLRSAGLLRVALSLLILAATGLRLSRARGLEPGRPAELTASAPDRAWLELLLGPYLLLFLCFAVARLSIVFVGFQTLDLRVVGLIQVIWIPLVQAFCLSFGRPLRRPGFRRGGIFAGLLLLDILLLLAGAPRHWSLQGWTALQFVGAGGLLLFLPGVYRGLSVLSLGYGIHNLWPFVEGAQRGLGLDRATPLRWVIYLVLLAGSLVLLGRLARREESVAFSGWLQLAGLALLVAAAAAVPGYFLLPFLTSPWDRLVALLVLVAGSSLLTAGIVGWAGRRARSGF